MRKSIYVMAVLLCMPLPAFAQSSSGSGNSCQSAYDSLMAQLATVQGLSDQTKADLADIQARMAKFDTCTSIGKLYVPGYSGAISADANGCIDPKSDFKGDTGSPGSNTSLNCTYY